MVETGIGKVMLLPVWLREVNMPATTVLNGVLFLLYLVARSEAYHTIVKRKPQANPTEPSILFSVFGHILLQLLVQALAYVMLTAQPW